METPLNLMSYDVNVALDAFERLYRQFKDNVRCTFSCEKNELLERLSAFPSPSAAMCTLMKELREEQKESIVEPEDIKNLLEQSVPPILQAISGDLLQHWIAVNEGIVRTAYYVKAVEIDPYNALLYISGPSVVLSGLLAPNVANCSENHKVKLASLTKMSELKADVLEEDDVVKILNDKVPVYTRYIMEAVKFVHESTTKREILR
jgi:hypothetical protein